MGEMSLAEKPIVPTAIDIMQQCRDEVHETVLIGTLAESQFVVMEQVLGSHPFKFSIDLGVQLEIHVSAPIRIKLRHSRDWRDRGAVTMLPAFSAFG